MTDALKRQLNDLRPLLAKASVDIGKELAFSVTTGSEAHRSLRVLQSLLNGMIDATSMALRLGDEETSGEAESVQGEVAIDRCHWCAATTATECLVLQASEGAEPRLLRVDHLCDSCTGYYWDAIRKAAKRRCV